MCGIAGIYDPRLSKAEIAMRLKWMTDVITHRGPDDEGFAAFDAVGIGMRRLSIIDVAGGQQPISNETDDMHVVSNGEIYNHGDLRSKLVAQGHRFHSRCDTESIIHLFEEHGLDCFARLRGMFGTAIWDERHQRLVLGRDRLGKKPLFYAQLGDRLLFGSEIKCLLAVEPSLREPDYSRLAEYLQFGFIHEPHTFYRHIKKLPAGHIGVWERGRLTVKPYWELSFEPNEHKTRDQWFEELDRLLLEAVQVRLESEVPLGVFLSGGIDSSAIVAYAHAAGLKPLRTFTIAFDRAEWDESADARRVADHFDTEHHELQLSEVDMRDSLPDMLSRLTQHFDEPFGDDSALPTYHVSKMAREHVTVILSGDGGDELFAGYSSYMGALFAQKYRRLLPYFVGRHVVPGIIRGGASLLPDRLRYQALRASKVCRDSALPLLDALRDKITICNRDSLAELLQAEVLAGCESLGTQYLPDPLWQTMQSRRDVVSRLTEIDIHSYMRDDILMKVDRMSMANSLEVRCPLLDHHVVELAATMPTSIKIRSSGGKLQGKAILREVLNRRLPPKTMAKRKQGFAVPLRDWFRGELADLVGDYLQYDGGRLPGDVFCKDAVSRLVTEHRRGDADHGRKIWLLLSMATWYELYQSDSHASKELATTPIG